MKLYRKQILGLIQNRKDGFANKDIAKRLKVSPSTVDYWFKRLREEGYEVPPQVYRGGRKRTKL